MKILITGTGVIGSVYGWQLSAVGHEITHFVRKGKKAVIGKTGVHIRCLDLRNGQSRQREVLYRPQLTEDISSGDGYELIIVTVKANQLDSILPEITRQTGRADILIFQNIWFENLAEITARVPMERVFFGQPHIMGGGKDATGIYCAIFGYRLAQTMLGEKDGGSTPRLLKTADAMLQARLNPHISQNIIAWLYTHYAEAAGLLAGIMKAGSARQYLQEPECLKQSVFVVREGFMVCRSLGVSAWRTFPQCLYYAPLFLLVPFFKRIYGSAGAQLMIDGHISHSPDEMKEMFANVMRTGAAQGIELPYHQTMQKYVDGFRVATR